MSVELAVLTHIIQSIDLDLYFSQYHYQINNEVATHDMNIIKCIL